MCSLQSHISSLIRIRKLPSLVLSGRTIYHNHQPCCYSRGFRWDYITFYGVGRALLKRWKARSHLLSVLRFRYASRQLFNNVLTKVYQGASNFHWRSKRYSSLLPLTFPTARAEDFAFPDLMADDPQFSLSKTYFWALQAYKLFEVCVSSSPCP